MKNRARILITRLFILAMVCGLFIGRPFAASAAIYSWTGAWEITGDWEAAVLTQSGNDVSGKYEEGEISGTVLGNVLTGTWSQTGSSGSFEFTMSADGLSFTIKWKYEGDADWYSTADSGTRLSALPTPSDETDPSQSAGATTEPAKPALSSYGYTGSWAGNWNMKSIGWGYMTLTQNGNTVSGAYDLMGGTITGTVTNGILTGTWNQPGNGGSGQFEASMHADGLRFVMQWRNDASLNLGSDWHTNEFGYRIYWNKASDWADTELEKSGNMLIMPERLKGGDMTNHITRAEFAAIAVLVYENLTGIKTTPILPNPFTDTGDEDVLKAYNTGLMMGVATDRFDPGTILNREQMATALTRVLKRAYILGWTFQTDDNYTLKFTQPIKFADDSSISEWAKQSVYFMTANGIINGTGNNMFSPRATTPAQQAANYASATREQALAIGVRLVEKLKDKPLDYMDSGAEAQPSQPATVGGAETQPAQPSIPPATGNLTLADILINAENAGFKAQNGTFFSEKTGISKPSGGLLLTPPEGNYFYGILQNDYMVVMDFSSAQMAQDYAQLRQAEVSNAVIFTNNRFYVEFFPQNTTVSADELKSKAAQMLFG